jgi:hypothetical protein
LKGRKTKFAFPLYTVETETKFRLRFHCVFFLLKLIKNTSQILGWIRIFRLFFRKNRKCIVLSRGGFKIHIRKKIEESLTIWNWPHRQIFVNFCEKKVSRSKTDYIVKIFVSSFFCSSNACQRQKVVKRSGQFRSDESLKLTKQSITSFNKNWKWNLWIYMYL